MELTYMVKGVDGKEYGPVSIETLCNWIREGRLPANQQVKRSDMAHWANANGFTELQPFYTSPGVAGTVTSPAIGATTPAVAQSNPAAAAHLRSGASWFYWIAGLSLVNSIVAFTGSSWHFLIGLGITQVIDAAGSPVIALVLNIVVAGVFVLFGFFAHKGHLWAFILGMVLFALDGIIFVLAQDWLGVGFHALILFFLFRGLSALRQLRG
jgi:hypothetical protein